MKLGSTWRGARKVQLQDGEVIVVHRKTHYERLNGGTALIRDTALTLNGVGPDRPIVQAPLSAFQTTRLTNPLRMLLVLLAAFHLAACSKTVQWEEEVQLNSGEILWVKRTGSFRRTSEPGNPFQSAWWPTRRALEFTWYGQRYEFETDTTSIMMLHEVEVPKGLAIVAWTKKCAKPGYGEFRWANGAWHLQPTVSRNSRQAAQFDGLLFRSTRPDTSTDNDRIQARLPFRVATKGR